MKLIPLVLALFAVSCTSPTRTAKNLIRKQIEMFPEDVNNYHSIEFGSQLDTVYASIVDAKRLLEGHKMPSHSEVRGFLRSIGNDDAKEVDSVSALYTDKEAMNEILEFYRSDKPTPIFLRMKHIFRCDSDKLGKNTTFDFDFYFDIGLTRVEFVEVNLPEL